MCRLLVSNSVFCRLLAYNYDMDESKFGQRVKELRIERDLTQESMAKEFNVHRTTVKDLEIRGKEPNYITLVKIAKFFEVSTDYLLGLEN